jgi:N-acetylmuramoyl-L-alanine amidase
MIGHKNLSNDDREIKSLLLPLGHKNRPGTKLKAKKAIVVHWTAAPGQRPEDVVAWFKTGQVYGSAQYVIGDKGEIVCCVPPDEVAWHVGSTQVDPASSKIYTDWARSKIGAEWCSPNTSPNSVCVGLELIPLDTDGRMSDETLLSTAFLIRKLKREYPELSLLATHHGIVGWKDCPRGFVRNPQDWIDWTRQFEGLEVSPA